MTSRIDYNDPMKDKEGALSLSYHYEMLSDKKRLEPFLAAIKQYCPGKVVFESGTGSGLLSILAAKSGAEKVFCSEIDSKMAAIAQENIKRNSCESIITLLPKSTLDVTIADLSGLRPDVLMAENLSTWQVTEPENEVMNHLRGTLAHADSISIPQKASNFLELCESQYRFFDSVELRVHYLEFTGIPRPRSCSEPVLFSTFDYSGITATFVEHEVLVPVSGPGIVNSLRLTSPLTVSPNNTFDTSDSLMPPVIVPFSKDITVSSGDTLLVKIAYRTNSIWEEFHCEASRIGG